MVMVIVVASMSRGVVVPDLAISTSVDRAEAIATTSSSSAPLMLGTMSPLGVSAAIPRLT